MKKLTTEIFINKAKECHNDTYNYDKVIYLNSHSKVEIICKKHGSFFQKPNCHLNKNGCGLCASKKSNTNDFIQKNIGKPFIYDKVIYINNKTNVELICIKHGSFFQTPANHLAGNGCPHCLEKINNTNVFIVESETKHKKIYSYANSIFVNSKTKIEIICYKHGSFWQRPGHHLSGNGCPKCSCRHSKIEIQWLDYLNIKEDNRQISLNGLSKNKKVDGFDPETNTVYQFHGDYWHGNPKVKNYDKNKLHLKQKHIDGPKKGQYMTYGELYKRTIDGDELIKSLGYNLVVMWEMDFNKQLKEDKIK